MKPFIQEQKSCFFELYIVYKNLSHFCIPWDCLAAYFSIMVLMVQLSEYQVIKQRLHWHSQVTLFMNTVLEPGLLTSELLKYIVAEHQFACL